MSPRAAPAELSPARADDALVERVLGDAGVAREPAVAPWSDYGEALGEALLETLVGAIEGSDLPLPDWLLALSPRRLLEILLALVLAALALLLVGRLISAWRRRVPAAAGTSREPEAAAAPAQPAIADPETWKRRLDRRLAAGELRAALEAMWWWLASGLAGAAADPAWTGGELLERVRRPDLAPQMARLEALLYGGRALDASALAALFGELEARLAGGSDPLDAGGRGR